MYIHWLTNEHTSPCMSMTGTFLDFGTEEYTRVIFLRTEEYIKTEEDSLFSSSVYSVSPFFCCLLTSFCITLVS
jgi:hypothetical protein